jgi:hypothetical protein
MYIYLVTHILTGVFIKHKTLEMNVIGDGLEQTFIKMSITSDKKWL